MKVQQNVDIPASIDDVWTILQDVPRVATCMPGATLTQVVDSDTFEGTVSIKVGPIGVQYQGRLMVDQRDAANYAVRMRAAGTDRKGSGAANAVITASLTEPSPGLTRLSVDSTVNLRGRIATLGRGIQDVADKILGDFAIRLSHELGSIAATAQAAIPAVAAATGASGPQRAQAGLGDGPAQALLAPPGTAPMASYGQAAPVKAGALLWSILRDKFKELLRRRSGTR